MKILKIRKSCIFILLLVGIMMLASQICCALYGNHKEKVHGRDKSITGILTEKKDTIDVVVLGGSESYTSISPMKLWQDTGITSFICGQGGKGYRKLIIC